MSGEDQGPDDGTVSGEDQGTDDGTVSGEDQGADPDTVTEDGTEDDEHAVGEEGEHQAPDEEEDGNPEKPHPDESDKSVADALANTAHRLCPMVTATRRGKGLNCQEFDHLDSLRFVAMAH